MSLMIERTYTNNDLRKTVVFKGEVWMANLGKGEGSEQEGVRPVLIVQNDKGNYFAPTTQAIVGSNALDDVLSSLAHIAPISSSTSKKQLPTHVKLSAKQTGLHRDSVAFIEQIRTIDKSRLLTRITKLNKKIMDEIDTAIKVSFGL